MGHANRRLASGVLVIALLVVSSVALIAGCAREDIPPEAISTDEAIIVLVSEIIEPAAEYERISAFMLSEPLQDGDVVTSSSGTHYPITTSTWFIFIDDAPGAGYAHNTRYVFVDANTATYTIVNQNWPPLVNNLSMWDTQNLNKGNLIEFWPILDSPAPIAGNITTAPTGDYGDAPDGQPDLYYGITGTFPTLYGTTNSHFGRAGGHTLNTGEETLGMSVSAEVDANDPNDPDGVPNLVDADSDERIFVIVDGTQAKLAFIVTVAPNAPDVTRYVNALIDFDQSGNWGSGASGTEWVVVNMEVDVDPGSSQTVMTSWFSWGNKAVLPSPVWMRVALTREKVDEALFASVGGWDGSGPFEYGEIEDHLVFLTGNPPPPPDGDGDGDGDGNGNGPPPPGPEEGPCGYKVNYYVLTINCGDSSDHIGEGTPYMQASADRMAAVADAQGYTSMGNLSPNNSGASQTSWNNIFNAFQKLADEVQCGDHVLIYICGHGYRSSDLPGGGISIANSNGVEQDILTPTDLSLLLDMIPPCEDLDCNLAHHCCHISVVIESCFAGNFNVPGVTGVGISVTGTSTDEESWLTYPRGGVYTYGLDKDLRDPASDTNDDGGVDPVEAHASAEAAVNRHNSQWGKDQDPWNNNQWCKCKCPCQPDIDVEKWAWYEPLETWADEIEVMLGELVQFRLEIESSGTCRDIIELEVVDSLPDCLEYAGGATIYHDGVLVGARPPDSISPVTGGLELYWDLGDIGPLAPGESIAIEYGAYAECPGENINILDGYALCSYDPTVVVRDTDWYQISVLLPEELLDGYLEVSNVESFWSDPYTCESFFDVYLEVEDLTGGTYPVTYVALYIDGWLYDFWETADTIVERHIPEVPVDCGEHIELELVAMDLVSVEPITVATTSFTTPSPQPPSAEDVLYVGFEAGAECTLDYDGGCLGCDVTIDFWAEDISSGGSYPVTNVVLKLDGVPSYYSGPISTGYFEHTSELEAWCGQTIEIEVVARNSADVEAIAADSFTIPSYP